MLKGRTKVQLGDFLRPERRIADIVSDAQYKHLTLSGKGGGAKVRKETLGRDVGVARYEIRSGDLVVSKIAARHGAAAVLPTELDGAVVSGDFLSYSIDTSIVSPKFLDLMVRDSSFAELCETISSGTTMKRINRNEFTKLKLAIPTLEEQQRIVDLIGSLDDAIEAADASAEASRSAAAELRRNTFETLSAQYPPVPAGELFEVMLGRQKSARQSVGDHVIPYVRSGNLSDGSLSLDVVQTMNFDPREQEKYCLSPGDVLIAEGGSVGQTSMWNGEIAGPVGFDKHVLRVRGIDGRSTGSYAFQWARWCYESGRFAEAATGITIKALGFDRAKRILAPAAPVDDQLRAVQILLAADAFAEMAKNYAAALQATRSELLNVLLSGEHEIPESYDTGSPEALAAA